MAADTQIDGAPTVTPDAVSVTNVHDVWFEYSLKNVGDEDDTSTGFYFTVDANGTAFHSDYAPDDAIPAGSAIKQGCKIDASVIEGLSPGDYWVTLLSPQGETLGAAALTIAP